MVKERSMLLWKERLKELFKYTSVCLTVTQLPQIPKREDGSHSSTGVLTKLVQEKKMLDQTEKVS